MYRHITNASLGIRRHERWTHVRRERGEQKSRGAPSSPHTPLVVVSQGVKSLVYASYVCCKICVCSAPEDQTCGG